MTLEELNQLPAEAALTLFRDCCAADAWARPMAEMRPFQSIESLHSAAHSLWPSLTEADWLEAFEAHPKIGDIKSLRSKYASTEAMASGEQSGAQSAPEQVLMRLKEGNEAYEEKFGFIFIVCATGKSAQEMLALLEARLPNSREAEIDIAAAEQAKITHIRLDKLL
ncbi:2-oxo-4-hydroxy-4-carboxy-5-ureidoimidazoline decarboxylase [Pseudomonas sp. OIL-1]|uniref:2-oxo-4-hydroxy-4-carboxy-5-ureidoimidazoline decarboxylase n=1 Tax=Pseudomonas sp. OIL-1 TaxID=2706126 RepID=UPI0013A79711|nr:2-oxo-4-hydroxy-4-carboxy-5-ureidoimidazoline decarboxylase [Pseudomonas sp. OIL-1]QIB51343.1 2-oxo-4-hydroxy-4-carboxy-5-ureidoimidazoline decarboxylase [Pseudomonas sp. OIL-1]